jgi:hypothetical protein
VGDDLVRAADRAGDPEDLAAALVQREVACVSEIWSDGDRETLIEELNIGRAAEGLDPIHYLMGADDAQGGNSGLVLLRAGARGVGRGRGVCGPVCPRRATEVVRTSVARCAATCNRLRAARPSSRNRRPSGSPCARVVVALS